MDVEFGRLDDRLFEERNTGDYVAFTVFDETEVRASMEQAQEFLNWVQTQIP